MTDDHHQPPRTTFLRSSFVDPPPYGYLLFAATSRHRRAHRSFARTPRVKPS